MAATNHILDFASLECLKSFHSAYVSLQVLSGEADTDSHHVANVLGVLNESFLAYLDRLSAGSGPAPLYVVKDE